MEEAVRAGRAELRVKWPKHSGGPVMNNALPSNSSLTAHDLESDSTTLQMFVLQSLDGAMLG